VPTQDLVPEWAQVIRYWKSLPQSLLCAKQAIHQARGKSTHGCCSACIGTGWIVDRSWVAVWSCIPLSIGRLTLGCPAPSIIPLSLRSHTLTPASEGQSLTRERTVVSQPARQSCRSSGSGVQGRSRPAQSCGRATDTQWTAVAWAIHGMRGSSRSPPIEQQGRWTRLTDHTGSLHRYSVLLNTVS